MKDHIQGFQYLYLGKVHDKPILYQNKNVDNGKSLQ